MTGTSRETQHDRHSVWQAHHDSHSMTVTPGPLPSLQWTQRLMTVGEFVRDFMRPGGTGNATPGAEGHGQSAAVAGMRAAATAHANEWAGAWVDNAQAVHWPSSTIALPVFSTWLSTPLTLPLASQALPHARHRVTGETHQPATVRAGD